MDISTNKVPFVLFIASFILENYVEVCTMYVYFTKKITNEKKTN